MPAADEVFRLQRGGDPESQFFQSFADNGHYRGPGGTRQGIYVLAPSGRMLGSINSLDPDKVIAMIDDSLKRWRELPDGERWLADESVLKPVDRWENGYPEGGLALASVNRSFERASDDCTPSKRWNRDHIWFGDEEASGWLPRDLSPGARTQLPEKLALRLARFHLVDNVRGQTLPFAVEEVERADFTIEVLSRTNSTVQLRITGSTSAHSAGPWLMGDNLWKPSVESPHGVSTEALGYATYDLDRERFTDFEMMAVGQWSGRTQFNGRAEDATAGGIGFVFSLATDTPAGRVPPAFIDVYE